MLGVQRPRLRRVFPSAGCAATCTGRSRLRAPPRDPARLDRVRGRPAARSRDPGHRGARRARGRSSSTCSTARSGSTPVWMCPLRMWSVDRSGPCIRSIPDYPYVNFGFWGVCRAAGPGEQEGRPQPANRALGRSAWAGASPCIPLSFYSRRSSRGTYGGEGHARAEGDLRRRRPAARPLREMRRNGGREMLLADIFTKVVDERAPVGFAPTTAAAPGRRMHGRAGGDRRDALAYIATAPGDLGLARAYVSGGAGRTRRPARRAARAAQVDAREPAAARAPRGPRRVGPRLLRRPPLPMEEAPAPWAARPASLQGARRGGDLAPLRRLQPLLRDGAGTVDGLHVRCLPVRDRDAGGGAGRRSSTSSARKLALQPGNRLLDVGAGWGGMVMHAAEHHGVRALGVTLSQQQADWAQRAIAERGLRIAPKSASCDYRDVAEDGFDAVSSIGLTEHIGARTFPPTSASCGQAAARRPDAEPHDHAALDSRAAPRGGLHRPLRVPRRGAGGVGTIVSACRTTGWRCATRRTCASTTR